MLDNIETLVHDALQESDLRKGQSSRRAQVLTVGESVEERYLKKGGTMSLCEILTSLITRQIVMRNVWGKV
jgi:hypothetical protein